MDMVVSKLGAVKPHRARRPPQSGRAAGSPWQGGGSASPVASLSGKAAVAPAPRRQKRCRTLSSTYPEPSNPAYA